MTRQSATVTPWSRGRLLAILGGMVLVGVGLIIGMALAVSSVITRPAPTPAAPIGTQLPADRDDRRDMLAAEPMLQVSGTDSTRGVPAATPGPVINIPASTSIGVSRVPSGFPRTPEGAIGQLAAIEVAVLSEMSIARTNEIYSAWSSEGAVPVDQWRLTEHVQAFLAASNMGQTLEAGARVSVTPVGAQTKANDGPDWTIACVLVDVRAVIHSEARMAYGYCERMQWQRSRWVIAPGAPPAEAPSTWPGTDLAFKAGWRSWPPAAR